MPESAQEGLRVLRARRRAAPALGALALAALAVGLLIGAGLPGQSNGAARAKAHGAATVKRRDLIATDTESGTLGYASLQTVYNRIAGTITSLPAVGQVITPGGTLYRVDNNPVVLFDGTVPAYRDLSPSDGNGPDVFELNRDLVALGFDPSHEITVDDTWQQGTTDAIDRWQTALGQSQTGTISFGQVVFLPGPQRITAVNTVLGSNGSAGSAAGSGAGSGTAASTSPAVGSTRFVSLETVVPRGGGTVHAAPSTPADPAATSARSCPTSTGAESKKTGAQTTKCPSSKGATPGQTLAALLALLKAETLELQRQRSSGSGASSGAASGGVGGGRSSASAGAGGGSAGGAASSSGSAGAAGSASGSATPILATTSTQEVVTVALDATKQSEAVVGEPVTVQLPDGSVANGRIRTVSPVAQSSSSSSSGGGGGGGGGGGSNAPSATIPVTIALTGHRHVAGLDQAAVSVNFEQQKALGVLSVPVTALLATAGGGYAVQEALAPHRLLPVTPGLFAAGYVQISGADIYDGLQVTDSQG